MKPEVQSAIERLEREDTENRAKTGDWPHAKLLEKPEEKMLALHPDTARLAHMMVQAAGYRNLVEIGVSHGYSTVWLADAARMTGGKLIALENNPRSVDIARRNIEDAGLTDSVEFVLGDALETLPKVQSPIDFCLLDCWEDLYIPCLKLIAPMLRPGGLLFADNVTPGYPDADKYLEALKGYPDLESVFVPIGRDLEVSVKSLAVA